MHLTTQNVQVFRESVNIVVIISNIIYIIVGISTLRYNLIYQTKN